MVHIESINPASPEYRSLYEESDVRTIFAHPAFVLAVRDILGFDVYTNVGREADSRLALTTFRRRLGPFRRFTHPAFCYYSAVLLRGNLTDPLQTIGSLAAKSGAERVQLPPLPDENAEKSASVSRFNTYLLDPSQLSPDNWSASRRRLFKKERDGFEVRTGTAEEVVNWSTQAYSRHGRKPPFDDRRMIKLLDRLNEAGILRIRSITHGSTVLGSVAILADDRRAYYWLAGSDPGPAMTVLLGEVFSELAEEGLSFDFLGANTPSIAEFKRRFGGTLVPHLHLHLQGSGSRSRIRRIFGR